MASVSRSPICAVGLAFIVFANHAQIGWAGTANATLSVSATVSAYCSFSLPKLGGRLEATAKCSTPPSSIDLRYLDSATLIPESSGLVRTIEYGKLPQTEDKRADILMVTVIY